MKTQFLRAWMFAVLISLLVMSTFPAWGQPILGDMAIVHINDIAKTLDIIDEFGAKTNPGQPLTLPVRAMLGNTDWIDPGRTAVVMGTMDKDSPTVYGFVPFVKPSTVFQQLTQAQAGPDYYLIAYPPTGPVPVNILTALKEESAKPAKQDTIFMEIPAGIYVAQLKSTMETAVRQSAGQSSSGLSEQDFSMLFEGFVDLFEQLQTLGIGVTLTRSKASISFEGRAIPGTQLAQALVQPPAAEARLANYKPEGPIQYRSRAYDLSRFMDLVKDSLGPFYAKLGIDLSCFADVTQAMTGEYVAGIGIENDKMIIEGIWCLKNPAGAQDLIDQMIQCTVDMTKDNPMLGDMPGGSTWERTKGSKVSGLDVKGMRATINEHAPGAAAPATKTIDMRLASQNGLVFMASTDNQLKSMIGKAKTLVPGKASGPLFAMDMDFSEFMKMAAQSAPAGAMPRSMPMTKMRITADMGRGQWRGEMAMSPDEIMAMVQVFQAAQGGQPGAAGFSQSPGDVVVQADDKMFQAEGSEGGQYLDEQTDYAEPEPTPEELLAQKVAGIVERGNLSAIYGGPKAAIKTYKEALKLDPNSPPANFAAALAYAELKEFPLALEHTEKALEFSPGNPVYMYGKARILLLAGQQEEAMIIFVEAANAGSEDAQNYLDHLSPGQ